MVEFIHFRVWFDTIGLEHVEFESGGAVIPKKLPAHELAQVGFKIHGTIAMEGGSHPVALHEVIVDVAKNVSIKRRLRPPLLSDSLALQTTRPAEAGRVW
jgi:hypothetical protein